MTMSGISAGPEVADSLPERDDAPTAGGASIPPWFGPEARAVLLDGELWHLLRTGWSWYNKM